MRDPNRIFRIVMLLGQAWAKYPDWRLGQLIENVSERNVFYIEDDVMEAHLVRLIEES